MGTAGPRGTGITTPAFAELYYVGGLWAATALIPLGCLLAWFDTLPTKIPVQLLRGRATYSGPDIFHQHGAELAPIALP